MGELLYSYQCIQVMAPISSYNDLLVSCEAGIKFPSPITRNLLEIFVIIKAKVCE